jgi:hypothetical protein
MKNVIILSLTFLVAACQTSPLKPGADKVSQLEDAASSCKQLGQIEEEDWIYGDFDIVKRKIKNRTFEMGGNAFTIDHVNLSQRKKTLAIVWECK